MQMTDNYTAITESGRGARITDRKLTEFSKEEIQQLMDKYRWLVFTGNPVQETDVSDFLSQYGELTLNDRRDDGVLTIDNSKEKEGEVLLGNGFLPLHQDGALMGTKVNWVGIFGVSNNNVTSGGRTFIVDVESAMNEVPKEYLNILYENGIEVKPNDGYYSKPTGKWLHLSCSEEVDGKKFLGPGFPTPKGIKQSWSMRIPGVSQEKFDEIFSRLDEIVMQEKYCYHHEWKERDLLLVDNRRTLHGREAFEGERCLANIQLLAE